jgi:hypothetical protein
MKLHEVNMSKYPDNLHVRVPQPDRDGVGEGLTEQQVRRLFAEQAARAAYDNSDEIQKYVSFDRFFDEWMHVVGAAVRAVRYRP